MALTKVSGSLIKSDITVGVVTATSFIGPLTGDVTGNTSGTASNLAGSPSINVTNLTASGNVSIAGTLTYEDVTNIDSVGIITARSDVSISDKIIHTGDIDTAIRFPAADTFTVETAGTERLRITSAGLVGVGTIAPQRDLHIHNSDSSTNTYLQLTSATTGTTSSDGFQLWAYGSGGNQNAVIAQRENADIEIWTNNTERVRIASAGQIGIGGTNYGTAGQVLTSGGSAAAPTWSAGSTGTGKVLEVLSCICDGTAVPYQNGTFNPYDIGEVQNLTTTFAFVIGSNATYQPPVGTSRVIYEFNFQYGKVDALSITSWKLFLDNVEVTKARHEFSGEDLGGRFSFKWVFGIGGSADASTGRVASWTGTKTIKIYAREYGGSYEAKIHSTNWWDSGSTDQLTLPVMTITAVG